MALSFNRTETREVTVTRSFNKIPLWIHLILEDKIHAATVELRKQVNYNISDDAAHMIVKYINDHCVQETVTISED